MQIGEICLLASLFLNKSFSSVVYYILASKKQVYILNCWEYSEGLSPYSALKAR